MTDTVAGVSVDSGLAVPLPGGAVDNLGGRLREVRLQSGLSLREVARQLGVSPSFISQMENGKSQPSVATLYSMAQLLNVSIDELFTREGQVAVPAPAVGVTEHVRLDAAPGVESAATDTVNRSDFTSPAEAWTHQGSPERLQILRPEERPQLVMDSGVVWQQLASNSDRNLDFMEIVYPPGASSTNDGRMLRHQGMEYGYLLTGVLQITHGFDTYTILPGQSMCLDPSVPHLLTNPGDVDARGIWVVHHCAQGGHER